MKIWIINHYAGEQYFNKGGRHYCLSKYLKQMGYEPIIICSNAMHNSAGKKFFQDRGLYKEVLEKDTGVKYVFVKGIPYSRNGFKRIANMIDFYLKIPRVFARLAASEGYPEVLYSSSPHILTPLAGVKISKRKKIFSISEIRDLWPESLIAYINRLTNKSLIIRLLRATEKYIYINSDKIVMTWEGAYDYIKNQGWETTIPVSKVEHIPNGFDAEDYNKKDTKSKLAGQELLQDDSIFKYVYTGSIRKVNNLGLLLDAAKLIRTSKIKILIYGDGDERARLEARAKDENITNVVFMGKVEKRLISQILSKADALLLHNTSTILDQYGQSQNKLFEYLASGKPILMTYTTKYSIVAGNGCGIEVSNQTPRLIAQEMENLANKSKDDLLKFGQASLNTSRKFDFKILSKRLDEILREL